MGRDASAMPDARCALDGGHCTGKQKCLLKGGRAGRAHTVLHLSCDVTTSDYSIKPLLVVDDICC